MAIINVRDYRLASDGSDDFPAFQRAVAVLESANFDPDLIFGITSGGILFIPTGHYRLSQRLVFKRPVIIQGSGLNSTTLEFQDLGLPSDETIAGIVFETEAGFSVIRDLSIVGKGGAAAPSNLPPPDDSQLDFPDGISRSGIELHAQALIENCFIAEFQHDGIHINTSVRGNADNWGAQLPYRVKPPPRDVRNRR